MIVGGYQQWRCHTILANLRVNDRGTGAPPHQSRTAASSTKRAKSNNVHVVTSASAVYRIPRGGLFEFVSSPHYLCEIIVYFGLALVAGSNCVLPAVGACLSGEIIQDADSDTAISLKILTLWGGVLATTCVNLYASAVETHAWYRAKFVEAYPASRTALVPRLSFC